MVFGTTGTTWPWVSIDDSTIYICFLLLVLFFICYIPARYTVPETSNSSILMQLNLPSFSMLTKHFPAIILRVSSRIGCLEGSGTTINVVFVFISHHIAIIFCALLTPLFCKIVTVVQSLIKFFEEGYGVSKQRTRHASLTPKMPKRYLPHRHHGTFEQR